MNESGYAKATCPKRIFTDSLNSANINVNGGDNGNGVCRIDGGVFMDNNEISTNPVSDGHVVDTSTVPKVIGISDNHYGEYEYRP